MQIACRSLVARQRWRPVLPALQSNYVGVSSDLLQQGQACGRCIKIQASPASVAALIYCFLLWHAASASLGGISPFACARLPKGRRLRGSHCLPCTEQGTPSQCPSAPVTIRLQCDDVSCKEPGKVELPAIVADVCGEPLSVAFIPAPGRQRNAWQQLAGLAGSATTSTGPERFTTMSLVPAPCRQLHPLRPGHFSAAVPQRHRPRRRLQPKHCGELSTCCGCVACACRIQ